MSIYYVSNLGCDANDGLSPEKAWKTVSRVNSSVLAGDEVRFRCGDTFYGHVAPPSGTDPESPTTYTSYGEGGKPTISQYKIAHADAWEQTAENVWRLDLKDITKFDGNTTELSTNVGFLRVSGRIYPHKCFSPDDLAARWDFYNDDRYVYVFAEKRPDELSDDVRFACRIGCIAFADHIRVTNLIIRGTGAHGISGVTAGAYIAGCEFHEIGGSELPGFPTPDTRYGNGVECWAGSCRVTVDGCRFSGIYDVAITMQGPDPVRNWEDMYFINNTIWNCQHAFEVWSSGGKPGTGFVNCHFENNVCIDSGHSWSYPVRPDKTASVHLLMYHLGCPLCDITVKGNVFSNARNYTMFKSGGFSQIPAGYRIVGNTILRPVGQPLAYRDRETDGETEAFERAIAAENGVFDIPADPGR